MMERYLTGPEKVMCRELWEEAFPEDSRGFVDYYFEQKMKDNQVLAILDEGQLQSMIHLNPYTLKVRGYRWNADYLVGVATKKDKRHQGYMRRLLMRMMKDMRKKQMPFCFLMPADEAIYRPFGFTYIYRQPHWRLREDAMKSLDKRPLKTEENGSFKLAAAWMNLWLENRYEMHTVRDETYLRRLADEVASENGEIEVLYEGGRMVGIVSEWGWERREQRLLYAEDMYIQEAAAPKPAIMARIISPEVFAKVVRLRPCVGQEELMLTLRLHDPLIEENEGVWRWTLDHEGANLKKTEYQNKLTDSGDQARPDLELTITELTAWLSGYELPAAAGHYGEMIEVLQSVFLDEVV